MSDELTEFPAVRGEDTDRVVEAAETCWALHWAWEGPDRAWDSGLASRPRAERFLRLARDTRETAATVRRFLARTWVHGDLTTADDAEVLAIAARQMATGHLRVAPWAPSVPDPRGAGRPPAESGGSDAPPAMAAATRSELTFIGIELYDEAGEPVPSEDYEITLPDGSVRKGKLNDQGKAEEKGIDPGTCKVKFPQIRERK